MSIARILRAIVLRRRRLAAVQPKHDEPRWCSPEVERFLMTRGANPVPAEEMQGE